MKKNRLSGLTKREDKKLKEYLHTTASQISNEQWEDCKKSLLKWTDSIIIRLNKSEKKEKQETVKVYDQRRSIRTR